MIIKYEMCAKNRYGRGDEWIEMCGSFPTWEAFDAFKKRESESKREVRNEKEVK